MRPASAADADHRGRGLGDALRLSFPEYHCKGRAVFPWKAAEKTADGRAEKIALPAPLPRKAPQTK